MLSSLRDIRANCTIMSSFICPFACILEIAVVIFVLSNFLFAYYVHKFLLSSRLFLLDLVLHMKIFNMKVDTKTCYIRDLKKKKNRARLKKTYIFSIRKFYIYNSIFIFIYQYPAYI